MLGTAKVVRMEEARQRITGSEVRAIFSEARRKRAEMPRPPLTMEMVRKQKATMKSKPCPPGTNSRAGTKRLAVTEGEPEGWAHILLRDDVSWEEFPIFAGELVARLSGKVVSQADLPDARMWQVEVAGGVLALVYEDHPQSILLEASSPEGVEILRELLPVLEGL